MKESDHTSGSIWFFFRPIAGRALYCLAVEVQVGHSSDHIPAAMREPPSPMPSFHGQGVHDAAPVIPSVVIGTIVGIVCH